MGKSIKYLDLSGENPGRRSFVEDVELGGELPVVGGKLTLRAKITQGSALSRVVTAAVTTFTLVSCGCACVITLFVIGLPRWVAAATLLLPAVLYLLSFSRHRASK